MSANSRNAVLAALGDRIRQIAEPDYLAYAAAEILGRELDVSRAGYGTIDPVAETITISRDWNAPGVKTLAGVLHFRDYGNYIEDLNRGTTVVISDAARDPRIGEQAKALAAISARAFVNMPVIETGGVVALLYLNHAEPRDWSDAGLDLIHEVAERTRTAVERRRAELSVRENEIRLVFLDRLGRATANCRTAEEVMSVTTSMLGQHLGVSNCAYADMDDDEDGFTIRGDWASPGALHILGRYKLADFGKKAVAELGQGRPLIVNDNLVELDPEEAQAFQSIGIGATICMPYRREGRLSALMAIHHRGAHNWTDVELALLAEVTERSWAHIERVRSEGAAREAAERLTLANNAAGIGRGTTTPSPMSFAGMRVARRCSACLPVQTFRTTEHSFRESIVMIANGYMWQSPLHWTLITRCRIERNFGRSAFRTVSNAGFRRQATRSSPITMRFGSSARSSTSPISKNPNDISGS